MTYRRVAVLGASGFVGRYVVQRLAASGAVITAVGRHAGTAGFLKPMGDVGQIACIEADLRDDRALAAVVAGTDAVVNAVGILYERGRQSFDALHHRLPARLGAAARAAGVRRIVHFSAIGADAQSPASYARSKAAGEAALHAAVATAIVLRPSIVFGPEDAFFNRFAAMARLAPALPLIGGGTTRFQPVYVGDVADAAMAALAAPESEGSIFELGGPEVYTFRALMALTLRMIGRKRLLIPVPYGLASIEAALLELLPEPPLTRDQVRMLQRDNVVARGMPGLAELGITPTALELILPTYLGRFRRRGASLQPHPA
ncbi:MAG TPA: complex I NDUFA9 subunit family protein [Stellaceae bacterium]|nr:complex I NDUFA9 subunit family protein [Stellaceae bacterium]